MSKHVLKTRKPFGGLQLEQSRLNWLATYHNAVQLPFSVPAPERGHNSLIILHTLRSFWAKSSKDFFCAVLFE